MPMQGVPIVADQSLDLRVIANLKVPLPPADEQQEIAEVLLLLTRRHMVATKAVPDSR